MENPYIPPSSSPEVHRLSPPGFLRVFVGFVSGCALPMGFLYLAIYVVFVPFGGELQFGGEGLPDARGTSLLLLNGILCAGVASYFRTVPLWLIAFSGLALPIGMLCALALIRLWA
jgi:hypothetical protein